MSLHFVFLVFGCVTLAFSGSCVFQQESDIRSDQSQSAEPPQLNSCLSDFVRWETQLNRAIRKEPEAVQLEHYLVPLKHPVSGKDVIVVHENTKFKSLTGMKNALLTSIDGVPFVKWVINPTDKSKDPEHKSIQLLLEELSRESGVAFSTERHKSLWGWPTASRSYVVMDPATGAVFSLKSSTQKPGGPFSTDPRKGGMSKRLTALDVRVMRATSDYVADLIQNQENLQALRLQEEPLGFYSEAKDIGLIARSLGKLTTCEKLYFPMFAAFHAPEVVWRVQERAGACLCSFACVCLQARRWNGRCEEKKGQQARSGGETVPAGFCWSLQGGFSAAHRR